MNKQVITGTLVLVAPAVAPGSIEDLVDQALNGKRSASSEFQETVKQAFTVHNGPVIVLPHNWTAMPVDLVRAQLDAVEREQRRNIGPSKPPPPPPPPAAPSAGMVCPVCKGPPDGTNKHKLLESMPPVVEWCDGSRKRWDSYPHVL